MLDTKYNAAAVEEGKYDKWIKEGYFTANDKSKKPFCIVIPPPNVTGKLHLGHAWDTTLQDIISRYKRLQGYDMLWLPGMDHAGIATQAKVDKRLREQGINPRSMDRDEWLKAAWSWKKEYAENIHAQWAKMGLSLDYSRERFTLDEGLNKAVRHVFVSLYNEGLIYRGEKIINWDPAQQTALSNEEVIYQDDEGAFYHLAYQLADGSGYLEVATTRPETMFGDTAVAVNPADERYKAYIGKTVILPIVNKEIPIVADEHADPEFGTGVVKITPAHDPNDFEVGNRHNLPRVNVMNPDGTMNENAGKYQGMDRYECREKLVEELKESGALLSIEKMTHSVGHSERSGVPIEPYLSKQWFVKMRPLADRVLENQKNPETKVNFTPSRFEKIMNHWMEITYDWCISRQLWWGHRIPAWYRGEEVYVGMDEPEGEGWVQDSDVLDTWFSSALWPFSTLGWPNETADFKRYYPNSVLVTGYDIIPFWVNRMTFQGLHFTGQRPFKDCLIHGLIRDEQGRKMSKSLGNGVDPMDVIAQYGVDSLRLFLSTNSTPGMDIRYIPSKVEASWNFINKLWNASRFVMMYIDEDYKPAMPKVSSKIDNWIIARLNYIIDQTTMNLDRYEFAIAGNELINFVWNDFCSSYIEFTKPVLMGEDQAAKHSTLDTLVYVLDAIVKLLHPFIPFVTEEIYQALHSTENSICVESWPNKLPASEAAIAEVEKIIEIISATREMRTENNVKPSKQLEVQIDGFKLDEDFVSILNKLCHLDVVEVIDGDTIVRPIGCGKLLFRMSEIVNKEEELAKIEKELARLNKEIARGENILANESFVAKAPAKKIEEEKSKLANYRNSFAVLTAKKEELLK